MDLTEDLRKEKCDRLKFAFVVLACLGLGVAIGFGFRYGLIFLAQNVSSTGGLVITLVAILAGIVLLGIGLSRYLRFLICPRSTSYILHMKRALWFYSTRYSIYQVPTKKNFTTFLFVFSDIREENENYLFGYE